MGQAKQRKEELKQRLLMNADWWTFPASEWEAALAEEILKLPAYAVPRADGADLSAMKMAPNQCHANSLWYARNDPDGQSRAVSGWLVQGFDFTLHSVVESEDQLFCVTPGEPGETEICFVPDPKIEWVERGGHSAAIRNGEEIGIGVRRFPAYTVALHQMIRYRLFIGMDPDQAQYFSSEELDGLMRQHLTADERSILEDI